MAIAAVAGPRVCSSCGAKSRADRPVCLRCGAALSEEAARRVAPPPSSRSRLLPVALGAAVLLVGLAYAWRPARESSPAPAASRQTAVQQAGLVAPRADSQEGDAMVVRSPELATDALLRGNAAYNAGNMDAALAGFRAAVDANPDDPDALNNLAQVLARGGRTAEAIPLLKRALEIRPDRWSYHFNLAHALGRTGDWTGAVAEYREADRLFPDDHVTLFNLGLALQKLGNHADAIPVLERAVALAPQEPDFLLALGQSYLSAERPQDARRVFEQYLASAPAGADAPLVRATLERIGR